MHQIIPISAFQDNYIWMGVHPKNKSAWVVDPGDATPILQYLHHHHLTLSAILLTHKHADHTGGVSDLCAAYPKAAVFGHPIEKISAVALPVQEGDVIEIDDLAISFQVLHVPGHTLGHVAYYTPGLLFSGDTLFAGGCGRIFEGTPENMLSSLDRLSALPENTQVYCAHEYTHSNLCFAKHVEPSNPHIIKRLEVVSQLRQQNLPTLPSTLALEKLTNPFLRCDQPEIQTSSSLYTGHAMKTRLEVFTALRTWKNGFKTS